jgi:hypothetical protein
MPVKQVLRLDPDAKNFIIFRRDITSPRLELALEENACSGHPANDFDLCVNARLILSLDIEIPVTRSANGCHCRDTLVFELILGQFLQHRTMVAGLEEPYQTIVPTVKPIMALLG